MRIYMPFCGIGFGHAMRAIPLGLALQKDGHDVYFATNEPVLSRMKKANFVKGNLIFEINKEIGFAQDSDKFLKSKTVSDSTRQLKHIPKLVRTQQTIIKKIKPDLIISDSVITAIFAGKIKKINSYYMANQTATANFFPEKKYAVLRKIIQKIIKKTINYSKMVLIPDFPSPYTFCESNIDYFGMKNKFFFTGPIINKKPEQVKKKKFKRKIFLVISGGTKAGFKNHEIFEKASEEANVDFFIMNNKREKFYKNVKYFKFVDDIYPYLKGCFSVLSHGGHISLMECAVYGKPVLGLSTKDMLERENNLNGLKENGMGLKINNMNELENAVKEIVNKEKYTKKADKFKLLSKKYDGIKNIIKTLE